MNGKRLLTVEQAAHYAGVSPATVRRWIRGGGLRKIYLSYGKSDAARAKPMIAVEWLDEFIRSSQPLPPPDPAA